MQITTVALMLVVGWHVVQASSAMSQVSIGRAVGREVSSRAMAAHPTATQNTASPAAASRTALSTPTDAIVPEHISIAAKSDWLSLPSTPSNPPHLVLRPNALATPHLHASGLAAPYAQTPQPSVHSGGAEHRVGAPNGWSVGSERLPEVPVDPRYPAVNKLKSKWVTPVRPPSASIPNGVVRPVWKQPYAYGYFGADSKGLWQRHHGYRDRSVEFRYR